MLLLWRGGVFLFISVLFSYDSIFLYFTDKCGLFNEILEPVIFIFKINTNIISIHIDVEYLNTNLILSVIKMALNVSVS